MSIDSRFDSCQLKISITLVLGALGEYQLLASPSTPVERRDGASASSGKATPVTSD